LNGPFFQGEEVGEDELKEKILDCMKEDATFNIVGSRSVGVAKRLGLVEDEGILEIEDVPFALVLS